MPWIDTELVTDRLRLRAFGESDKPAIVRLLTDPEVRRYLGGPAGSDQVDGLRSAVVGARWGAFCIAELATGEVVGTCSFGRNRGEQELSYQVLPEYWAKGLAGEAIAAALDWIWAATDDDAVIAVTQTANERSLKLLDRLGFTPEREFDEFGAAQVQLRLRRPTSA